MEINITDLINSIKNFVKHLDYEVVPKARLQDYVLYTYKSYEEYRDVQIKFNKEKINNIWADDTTLERVVEITQKKLGPERNDFRVLCHGSRNGYEVRYLQRLLAGAKVLGTDISDNASQFDLVQWDFHDVNADWVQHFDMIYTNSLDQSWNPREALRVWLDQLNDNGILIIEHTDAHSTTGAGKMDPFGVRPVAFPYLITMWFGDTVALSWSIAKKDNMDLDAYLFVIRKTKFRH